MKIKFEKGQLDLGTTPIENMLINTYLSQATGNQIKVYIYTLSQIYSNKGEISNSNIASEMNLSEGQVVDAFNYWIEQGLIEKRDDTYIFKSVRSMYINALTGNSAIQEEKNRDSIKYNDTEKSMESKQLIENIEQFISMGSDVLVKLNSREIRVVLEFMNEFNLDSNYLSYAYMTASSIRNIKSVDPVIATLRNWAIDGVTTQEELDKYIEKQNSKNSDIKNKKNERKNTKSKSSLKKDTRMSAAERKKFIMEKLNRPIQIDSNEEDID